MKKIYGNLSLLLLIIFSVFFNLSCVTGRVSSSWVDSEYQNGPFRKIVVIGLFRNFTSRKEFENAIAKKISGNSGTLAIPSLDFMPPDVKYELGTMEKQFSDMGIDGILIVRTKSIDTETRYIPGKSYTVTTAHPMYYYDYPYYYKYYRYTYETIREPGYYKDTFIVSTESTLFQNSNDKMIWMMQKETTQSYETIDGITNPVKEGNRSAGLIFNDLKGKGFLLDK